MSSLKTNETALCMLIWNDPQDKILNEKVWFEERRMNKQNTEGFKGTEMLCMIL